MKKVISTGKAREILGVSDRKIRGWLAREDQGSSPPKKRKAGGRYGYRNEWEDEDHLEQWETYHRLRDEGVLAHPPKAKAVHMVAVPPAAKSAVVGIRQASSVLGITKNVIYGTIMRHIDGKYPHLMPKRAAHRADGKKAQRPVFYWIDEDECRKWWDAVCVEVRGEGPQPPAVIGVPKGEDSDEATLTRLLGKGTVQVLVELRDRLDTPNIRAYRRAQGVEPHVPLKEALTLVVGLGLTHWDELLEEEEE